MRTGQPNFFLTFDRLGIDPFTDHFAVTLLLRGHRAWHRRCTHRRTTTAPPTFPACTPPATPPPGS